MGALAEFVKKHPEMIGLAVIVVVILAYMQSRTNVAEGPTDSSGVTFTGGGVASQPVDPGVVAMEEARISAGTANLSTLSQLFLGLNEAAYQRDVEQGQTNASLSASLAQTEAQRATSLAATEAGVTINSQNTAASIQAAQIGASAATTSAQINAKTQADMTAANLQATLAGQQAAKDASMFQTQAAKDEARAADNTSIVTGIINFGEHVVEAIFNPLHYL